MKFLLSIIVLFSISVHNVYPIWQRNIINYERSVYQGGFQNWDLTQAENGWIYFANSRGLLEFDGVFWNLYPVKNKVIRSVKIIDDKIYIGSNAEFGYFEADSNGKMIYHSLSENLERGWGDIWSVAQIKDEIYFLTDYSIFILTEDGSIKNVSSKVKIDYCSTTINECLYIASTEGLFYLDDNKTLQQLTSSNALIGEKIVGLHEYEGKILLATARAGIYIIDNDKCEKVKSIADDFILRNQLFCTALNGSKMLLGSVQSGAFLFDLKVSGYKEVFNLDNGLRNNTILHAMFDRKGNLWLGLDKGIAYLDMQSPVRPLFAVNSPIGTGYCSIVFNNEIYLGTNQGLYKLDEKGSYKMITNSEGQIWSLNIIDNQLFSAGDNGVLVISPHSVQKINVMGVWGLERLSSDENVIIAGTYSGFRLIEKNNGRWSTVKHVEGFNSSARGFIEDEVKNTFWTANSSGDIYRVTIDPKEAKFVDEKCYKLPGQVVGDNTFFRKIYNNIVICGSRGIFQYSRVSDEFIPYPQLESTLDGHEYYDFLNVDTQNNIWFVTDKTLKMQAFREGNYVSKPIVFGLENDLIDASENVTLVDPMTAIVAVDKAFLKIDLNNVENYENTSGVWIRKVSIASNDSVVSYNGMGNDIEIPYNQNSVNIYFSATEYSYGSEVLYSYRLKGLDSQWSAPSYQNMKEYSHLNEGNYTFEVKAFLSGDEEQIQTAAISFRILPPWYRSIWALFAYLLLFMLFIFFLYKMTIKKQKLIMKKKAEEFEMQSKVFERQRIQKDQEIYKLQNENLQANLNYKTQELNGYILNLIRKNEMLEEVKNEVLNISKALDENKQSSVIKQKVVKLTSQINSNIEKDKDFEMFQSNFNLLHKDFFRLLEEHYPGLTRNDKILSAYLKMNLTSKEIAPLLNISVRGVEVNRYRLRKKMNLGREVNLSEFMQNLSDVSTDKEK